MKLLTKEILNQFPMLGETGSMPAENVRIIAKFFYPAGAATWYATEYDPEERLFFGFVNLGDSRFAELGTFSLDELQNFRGRFGLGIERDRHFGKHYLSEVLKGQQL